ncbi:hypothetical protein OCK74_01250 [Chitinophagaceae bacterium LB-8]|uniref:Acid-shock protein n=1 Tax=Paraflavisolibacter caeni TaxID=2982496 RepID=A0A9X2XRV1_9BACT|nr:hypothetical protein [Paraflavisolibacter caeni]MCU7547714.1 hypothetical protein [Paraflavisolibacter caeni]
MKKLIIPVLAMFFVVGTVHAQAPTTAKTKTKQEQPAVAAQHKAAPAKTTEAKPSTTPAANNQAEMKQKQEMKSTANQKPSANKSTAATKKTHKSHVKHHNSQHKNSTAPKSK